MTFEDIHLNPETDKPNQIIGVILIMEKADCEDDQAIKKKEECCKSYQRLNKKNNYIKKIYN